MNKADKYIVDTIMEITTSGNTEENVRAKWRDGSPATTKFVTQKHLEYNIEAGEFPIPNIRKTNLNTIWFDIEAIYIKQTNIVEEMNPAIQHWWKDFSVHNIYKRLDNGNIFDDSYLPNIIKQKIKYEKLESRLGNTYGAIVREYDLMNKLLVGLEQNPFGRRHMIDMWQYAEQEQSPTALPPCAFLTMWTPRKTSKGISIDLSLIQRSQDYMMTMTVNAPQYLMLGMAVCNHLTFKTGVEHTIGKFSHFVQNCHIYERHFPMAAEVFNNQFLIQNSSATSIELICEPKDFFSHTEKDFVLKTNNKELPLSKKLEMAV